MHLLKYFDKFSLKPENAKELKGLILDLAIRGRLTEEWRGENSDVESASVLLKRIKKEKDRLVKEKKIKKEKPLPEIEMNDILFELPLKWEWTTIKGISYLKSGNTFKKNDQVATGDYKFIKVSGMNLVGNEKFITTSNIYIAKNLVLERDLIPKGAIIFPKRGGAIATNKKRITKESILVDPNVMAIIPYVEDTLSYINKWFLNLDLWTLNNGTSVPQINNKDIEPLLFPLPPLTEQKAIVKIVNQLMDEVDQLETQTKTRVELRHDFIKSSLRQLTTANSQSEWLKLKPQFTSFFDTTESIDRLKEAILQLAVQGKLTKYWREENPNVESASVLLEKINEEKAQLIKEKKIKKEKPLPEITVDEIPYELPEGWTWCRIIDLVAVGTGATPLKSNSSYYGGTIPWFTSSSTNKLFAEHPDTYITELALQETNCKVFPIGTLLVAMYGQGKTRGQITELLIGGASNQAVAALLFYENSKSSREYVKYFFRKIYTEIRLLAEGGAQPNLNVGKVKSYKIPFPPIAEQKAIVHIVNQLMDHCDQIKSEIENRNSLSKNFLQSSIREVMEKTKSLA